MPDPLELPPLNITERFLKYAHENHLSVHDAYNRSEVKKVFGSEKTSAFEAITKDPMIRRHLYGEDPNAFDPLPGGANVGFGRLCRYSPVKTSRSALLSLFYIAFGSCRASVDGAELHLERGDFLFVSPMRSFSLDMNRDDLLVMFLGVRTSAFLGPFSALTSGPDALSDYFSRVACERAPASYLILRTYDDARPREIMEALRRESVAADCYSPRMFDVCFEWLMTELCRTRYPDYSASNLNDSRAMQIIGYMSRNLDTVTLRSVAENFNYSTSYICRLISASTGSTFSKLLTDLKLQRACILLKENRIGIDRISELLGYSDISSFYRAFRRVYNCTPVEYRKKNMS